MKKITKIIPIILLFLFFIFIVPSHVNASAPLDEIRNYNIKVNMRTDGTMDIRYQIEWKVLDDTSEGPLSWVKIGNPNKHVDEITALSENIKEIKYSNDGGSYIRIDLDREYHKDEVIILDYTIHQSYMYILEKDNHICRYSFTPGWFEEIEIKKITIKWKDENVIESNSQTSDDGYLIWTSSLGMGERLNASVKYNLDTFTTNENEQYTEDSGSSGAKVLVIVLLSLLGLFLLICLLAYIFGDDYDSHGGFGGRSSTHIHTHSSCVTSSCVSSCACACACAGGGRAGCTKKDFYQTNLKSNDIKEVLKK